MHQVLDRGRGLVAVVNKWDAVERDNETMGAWVNRMRERFKPLEHVPLVFISVHHNLRVWKVLEMAMDVYVEATRQIPTGELNRFLQEAVAYLPPPAIKGKRIQIKYAAQVHREPPLFAFFTNHPRLIPINYRRYLENRLRQQFGFEGVPVKLSFRAK